MIPELTLGPAGALLGIDDMNGHRMGHSYTMGGTGRQMSMSMSLYPQAGDMHSMSVSMPMQILDQDISLLMSLWLGVHQTSSAAAGGTLTAAVRGSNVHHSSASMDTSNTTTSNKCMALLSSDEGRSARKKQSLAIRPMLRMSAMTMMLGDRDEEQRDRDRDSGSTSPLGFTYHLAVKRLMWCGSWV